MKRRYLLYPLVFLLYSLITAIVNYPLLTRLSSATYGYVGDNYGYLWQLWWWRETPRVLIDGNLTPLLGAPQGAPINYYFYEPLLIFVGRILTLAVNYFAAFNILLLLTFPLAGLTTFILVKKLTESIPAALISGMIFAFCPYHFWHSYAHFSLAQTQWLPVFLLALILFSQLAEVPSFSKRHFLYWLFLLGAYELVLCTCFIYGVMALILAVVWLGGDLLWRVWKRNKICSKQFALLLLAFFLVAGLSGYLNLLRFKWLESAAGGGVSHSGRDIDHALALSARPWDYFVPAHDHPIFGKYVDKIRHIFWSITEDWRMASPFKPEDILYLGFVPFFLAIYSAWAGRKSLTLQKIIWILVFTAIAFIFLSFPPFLPWRSWRVYFPSAVLFKIFPSFRVFARLGLIVCLMVAILAGYGVKFLWEKLKLTWERWAILTLIIFGITFEFLNVPPFDHYTDYSQLPCYYQWLRNLPGDFIIADYPLSFDLAEGLVWQTFHKKRLFNTSSEWPQARWAAEVEDLENPDAVLKLKELGVRYVVYHVGDYLYQGNHLIDSYRWKRFGPAPDTQASLGLKPVLSCDGSVVFEVEQ